jgi:hypothetical protein
MIEGMDKLKVNFMQAMRRWITRWAQRRNGHEAISPPADAGAAPRHPLLGALKGLVCVMPGTDLTKPADPGWGKG